MARPLEFGNRARVQNMTKYPGAGRTPAGTHPCSPVRSIQDILLRPGGDARLETDFEEYRPQRSTARFQRRIGRYVSHNAAARFERQAFRMDSR